MKQELRINVVIADSGSSVMEAKLTPEYLAKLFWNMTESEQALFFNWLGENADAQMPFQLQAVADCKLLNSQGRYIMGLIGNYSEQGA